MRRKTLSEIKILPTYCPFEIICPAFNLFEMICKSRYITRKVNSLHEINIFCLLADNTQKHFDTGDY